MFWKSKNNEEQEQQSAAEQTKGASLYKVTANIASSSMGNRYLGRNLTEKRR